MNNKKMILDLKSMLENNDLLIKYINKIWNHNQINAYRHREF